MVYAFNRDNKDRPKLTKADQERFLKRKEEVDKRIAKYRKRPIIVEAIQWFEGMEIDGVWDRASLSEIWFDKTAEDGRYYLETVLGNQTIKNGDYIVTKIDGEKYVCKQDIFEIIYEKVEDDNMDGDTIGGEE